MKIAVFLLMALTGAWAWSGWAKFINEFQYLPPEYLASFQFKEDLTILLLVTAVPVVFVLYFRQWGKIGAATWWLIGLAQLLGFAVLHRLLLGPGDLSDSAVKIVIFALAVACLAVMVFLREVGTSDYPVWLMLGEVVGIALALHFLLPHVDSSREAVVKNNLHSIQLAMVRYKEEHGGLPQVEQIEGGVSDSDQLIQSDYLQKYPGNAMSEPYRSGGDFFWSFGRAYDFIDLGLLPENELQQWSQRAQYDPATGKRLMVNVRPIYREVWEEFRRRKEEGEVPSGVEHPFAGHFMYLAASGDGMGPALVGFSSPYSGRLDALNEDMEFEQDGELDGVATVLRLNVEGKTLPEAGDSGS